MVTTPSKNRSKWIVGGSIAGLAALFAIMDRIYVGNAVISNLDRRVTVVETQLQQIVPLLQGVEAEQRARSLVLSDIAAEVRSISKRLDAIDQRFDNKR